MRIAVVSHTLRVAGGLSVGKNIMLALREVADQHDYLITLPYGVGYESIEGPRKLQRDYFVRKGGPFGQMLYEHLRLPKLLRRFKPDVIWCLGNYGLRTRLAPQAVLFQQAYLVYDEKEQVNPIWKLGWKKSIVKRKLRASLPFTSLVFCQTETIAKRFRKVYHYDRQLEIMPNAVSLLAQADTREPPAPLQPLRDMYVLFCLTKYYPHKNLEALVGMFEAHGQELKDVRLVLTIDPIEVPVVQALVDRIRNGPAGDFVINVGTLDQPQLPGYFQHTQAMILPTVLESFSGTYLEAMHFGAPILTSDMDFARGICGDAALYFDPYDVTSMKDAVLKLKNDAALREALIEEGQHRRASFVRSWSEITAEAVGHLESLATNEKD